MWRQPGLLLVGVLCRRGLHNFWPDAAACMFSGKLLNDSVRAVVTLAG